MWSEVGDALWAFGDGKDPGSRGMTGHRKRARAICGLCTALLCAAGGLALLSAPAFAITEHPFLSEMDGSNTPTGRWALPPGDAPCSTAVDSHGDVYVSQVFGSVVDVFDSAGNYLTRIAGDPHLSFPCGMAIDSTGNLYVANLFSGVVKYSPSSFPITSATTYTFQAVVDANGTAVAVNPGTGEVYVDDGTYIAKYDSSGAPVATIGSGILGLGPNGPSSNGVDVNATTGEIYVSDASQNAIIIFSSAGNFTGFSQGADTPGGSFQNQGIAGLAIDQSTGHVYVVDTDRRVVDELDASGAYVDRISGTPSHGFSFIPPDSGVAIDNSGGAGSGDVYVADSYDSVVDAFGPRVTLPDVTTGPVSNLQPTSVTLNGTVNPDSVAVTSCQFDYGTDTSYGQTAPCVEAVGSGAADVPIYADVTGLDPDTTYHFRLEAGNANGSNFGQDQTFISPSPPFVDDEFVTEVGPTVATLHAQVNPAGSDTTYHFDYGTDSSYGHSTQDTDIGSANSDQAASAGLAGLESGTTYHYRVVATNAYGTTNGPDKAFRYYQTGAGLPEGRAYELVSPAETGGANVIVGAQPSDPQLTQDLPKATLASPDGDHLAFYASGAFPDTGATEANGDFYAAARGDSGWGSVSISVGQQGVATTFNGSGWNLWDVTPDFSTAFFTTNVNLDPNDQDDPDQTGGAPDVYARHADGSFSWISQGFSLPATNLARQSHYAGRSADATHVVFESNDQLLADAPPNQTEVYERIGGQLRLASLLPDNSPAPAGAVAGSNLGRADSVVKAHAVSADGSKIFFSAPTGSTPLVNRLYVRKGGQTTVEASESQRSTPDPAGPRDVKYWGAAVDGSTVFFTSAEGLTDDATTGAGSGNDLYTFDTRSGQLRDLAPDASDSSGAGVLGVAAISDDGSKVYFVARGKLVAGKGTAGAPNLYLWDRGTLSYIATLASADERDWAANSDAVSVVESTARVSPDGSKLLFVSVSSLTGYSNAGFNEAYEYDADTGQLICVSCNPSGARAEGGTDLGLPPGQFYTPHNVLDDGRAFFDTTDALVAGDTNGRRDVYEYLGGGVRLISAGDGTADSAFVDTGAGGRDAFFVTSDALVSQDREPGMVKVYDARVGGGFASPPPPPPCAGDECQGTPSPPLALPTPASITFTGPGNASSRSAAAKVTILSRSVRGAAGFLLSVRVPGKGRITISGAGLRRVTSSVGKAAIYHLRVRLTARARSALRHRHRLRLRVRVGYRPASGSSSTATVALTVKR
jgi:hypothetical protein